MSAALPSPSDRFRVWLLGAWRDAQQPPRAMPESSVAYTIRSNVRAGELQKIKQMFKDGVDIEAVMEPSDTLRKWTPLHIAAQQDHVSVVSALLEHDADPNLARTDGTTPLYQAAENGHADAATRFV